MVTYAQLRQRSPHKFKRYTGVKHKTFLKMLRWLRRYRQLHPPQKAGRPPKLPLADQLLLTIAYWREYRTFFHLAQDWGLHESTVWRIVINLENILIQNPRFHVPGRKALYDPAQADQTVVVDATESPVERPRRGQKGYYSGKKKQHTLKAQVVAHQGTKRIICVLVGPGKEHDFALYKRSQVQPHPEQEQLADSGYQGLTKRHGRSQTPHKKPRKGQLTREQKRANRALARRRIVAEHLMRHLKIFQILRVRYRNRRRRFGLRLNLIAGLYNCDYGLTA